MEILEVSCRSMAPFWVEGVYAFNRSLRPAGAEISREICNFKPDLGWLVL